LKDIRQKLLATFQIEHRDHVEQIRSLLALVGKTNGQPPGAELEEAFRRAHSLKGAARAVDLRPVEGLAHRLETLFSRVRQGVLLLDANVAGVVQQVLDASEDCVAGLGENRPIPGFGTALQAIERLLGIEPEAPGATEPVTAAPVPAFQPIETLRIKVRNFDGLLRSAVGLLAESQRQNQVAEHLKAVATQLAGMEKEAESLHRGAAASLCRLRAVREFSRVSSFLDSMERQVRSLSRQAGAVRGLQLRSSWTMRHMGKQLEQDIWQARMAPAESLLDGYRKMVRDLARDQSKEIEFRATSTGVHADRRVLEALKDPLMHILRNAISHGIELPRERTANGKSPMGVVTLRIESNGQNLTVAVMDDGCGVDLARVADVAVRQRILSESEAALRSPEELGRLIFRPGFSTSRSVTDLSGRGMGLSVVYETIRRLQGEVELRPLDGGGTFIHISVPLSISTHRLLLVSCARQSFAVPIHGIERLHRIRPDSVQTLRGKPVITLDGQPAPLFSMRQLLNLEHSSANAQPDMLRIMALRSGGRRAAVMVDAFLWETDAVIQNLGPAAPSDGKVSGAILLEDGAIAFVLNLVELLQTSVHQPLPDSLKPSEGAQEQVASTILVVDDSMTTRMLEKSILEAHGYKVRVAVDGMEALDQLRAEKADLVISDLQMPRLDGFGLLETMKKDPSLARIPVIVVSSLDRPEDQERGLSLGADAYIVKRKFDQGELLATIRQIL
jgi:two-component system chemotaxis sensor kinase CheA